MRQLMRGTFSPSIRPPTHSFTYFLSIHHIPGKYTQIPQISSSHKIDLFTPFNM